MSNLADILGVQAANRPQAPAVIDRGRVFDFKALDGAVWRAAAALRRRGLAPGDIVGVSLPDDALHMVVGYALARMGAIQLPLSLRDSSATRDSLAQRYGAVTTIGRDDVDPAWLEERDESIDPAARAPGGDAGWKISLSSGTGGAPKAVVQTHAMALAWRPIYQAAVPVRPEDRYVAIIGLDFLSGFRQCMDMHWNGAATLLCDQPKSVEAALELIGRERISYALLTAFHLDQLLAAMHGERPRFPALTLRTGAMVSTHALRCRVLERITPHLVVSYGTNDVGTPFTVARGETLRRFPDSIGFPVRGVELRITGGDGRELPAGETGEIGVRAAGMPQAYLDDPEATARAFRGGWFYPGDLGYLSAEGALYFRGRTDDLMNRDGLKVYPAEIESALESHPAVAAAAAFPLPSERHQDLPVAAVVLRAACPNEALLAWCRQRLGKRAPIMIVAVDALPRTALGKVDKRALASAFAIRS